MRCCRALEPKVCAKRRVAKRAGSSNRKANAGNPRWTSRGEFRFFNGSQAGSEKQSVSENMMTFDMECSEPQRTSEADGVLRNEIAEDAGHFA